MKHLRIFGILFFFLLACQNEKTKLFNGKNLEGWHMDVPKLDSLPNSPKPFVARDGILVSLGVPRGHLITNSTFENYRLEVEYRFPGEPGNCGVLVHASTPRALYQMFPKSLEIQMEHNNAGDFWVIVEDITVDNMVARRGPKNEWGITERTKRRIVNLTDDSEKSLGDWNNMVIECYGDKIKVWLNGELVNYGYDATVSSGQIAIQAEGAEVEFRKLCIQSINGLTE
ncbi:MAG: DUF1080 domain-containing protein [Bacteroidota bacterium]